MTRILLLVVTVLLCWPGAAHAVTLIENLESEELGWNRELVVTGTGGGDRFALSTNTCGASCLTWTFTRVLQGDELAGGHQCTGNPGAISCSGDPAVVKRLRAATAGGSDHIEAATGLPLLVDAGEGGDTIIGGLADGNVLHGGGGDDTVSDYDTDAQDELWGDGGDDQLTSYVSAGDVLRGGPGTDTARFAVPWPQQGAYTMTLDGDANDGRKGAATSAFLASDIENLDGAGLDDTLAGNDAANRLRGMAGADDITGGGGADDLQGGPGNDTIRARDGVADAVDCGDGNDAVIADRADALSGCEVVDVPPPPPVDADGDGISPPADCDDADPATRPGAPDPPDDGRDQDCSGADAVNLDRDGDGIPRPADCRDDDATIRPGAADAPGDGVDQDCAGGDAAFPRLDVSIFGAYGVTRRDTRFQQLEVRRAAPGMTVTLRCSGRGCPFKQRSVAVRTAGTLKLTRHLRGARLKPGAQVEVAVTAPGAVGRQARWTVRARKAPRRADADLAPARR